jgi:hypothetical protein
MLWRRREMSKAQQLNPKGMDYRCERCWSEKDINLSPKSEFLGSHTKGFVILCERCKGEAPQGKGKEDAFENLFLKFASPKEFIQYYDSQSEAEAFEKWCETRGVDPSEVQVVDEEEVEEDVSMGNVEDHDAPFGYELINGMLTIINGDADVVHHIYDHYMSGHTMESIARGLVKSREGKGNGWNVGVVRDILKNPAYAGYEFKGGDVKKAEHPPIIPKDLFNSVQERIQRNIRNPRYRAKPLILGD